jgi:hypothetical protein
MPSSGMPGIETLVIFIVAIFVLWIVLKLARFAIRLIFLFVSVAILAGVIWFLFAR